MINAANTFDIMISVIMLTNVLFLRISITFYVYTDHRQTQSPAVNSTLDGLVCLTPKREDQEPSLH